jgi:hypothetical protein
MSKLNVKTLTVPEIAIIAATSGAPGFGAGPLPADKFRRAKRRRDEIICAVTPEAFLGVGMWYLDFSQRTDDEVRDLLERARGERREKQMSSAGSE